MTDARAQSVRERVADSVPPEVLVVEGLCREFDERRVVDDFGLTLRTGERVALCGPNGSGKTTILRCIIGTLLPTSGEISVVGHPAGSIEARAQIGALLPLDRAFYLRLSGRTNLRFVGRLRGLEEAETTRRIDLLEEELRLSETLSRRLDRCSTGMLQKLSLARALLSEPPLLLMDEPTRSLDEEAVELLWGALERRRELSLLIATHRGDDLDRCARRIDLGP